MATPGRASDTDSQPFREQIFYKKLAEPDEIRLLILQPAGQQEKSIVFCRLLVAALDDPNGLSDLLDEQVAQHPEYEAVSWCWGDDEVKATIKVCPPDEEQYFDFSISANLNDALQSLRYSNAPRRLWIDAICIDQGNTVERNSQVPKMDRIYGQAINVCVWVGMDDDHSTRALKFIREHILKKIWDFDDICANPDYANHWASLIRLMSRPWFSRRWVIQEIALANNGTLYCGKDWIPWQDFADAVSLFVHVESATHRLSDVMKKVETFANLPQFFGDVHALGAALLVDATTNLFRTSQDGKRHPRLSLEHLISKYSLFQASQPRDVIYAFLSIAKDTKPETSVQSFLNTKNPEMQAVQAKLMALPRRREIYRILTDWSKRMNSIQPYVVNYDLPAEEVYRDFIQFSIHRAVRTDATRALDIICRPWAPRLLPENNNAGRVAEEVGGTDQWRQPTAPTVAESAPPLPSWIPDLGDAPFGMDVHTKEQLGSRMKRRNADPLVGLPSSGERIYNAAGTRTVNLTKIKFTIGSGRFPSATKDDWGETSTTSTAWDFAPCSFEPPTDASFRVRRPDLCHCQLLQNSSRYYSMLAEGFVLDEIGEVQAESQLGAIPPTWLQFAQDGSGRQHELPDDLWRTLVADRGPNGQNALTFYLRTCREAFKKLVRDDQNPLNTTEIIETGGCTIIAEFLRRVQAVIWNRRLMRTKDKKCLGLVPAKARKGDLICILYGCSVPVVMRRRIKSPGQIRDERIDQQRFQRKAAAEFIARNWRQSRIRNKVRMTQKDQPFSPSLPRSSTYKIAGAWFHSLPRKLRTIRQKCIKLTTSLWSIPRHLASLFRLMWMSLLLAAFSKPLYRLFTACTQGTVFDLAIPAHLKTHAIFNTNAATATILSSSTNLISNSSSRLTNNLLLLRLLHLFPFDISLPITNITTLSVSIFSFIYHLSIHLSQLLLTLTLLYLLTKPYAIHTIQHMTQTLRSLWPGTTAKHTGGPNPKYYYTMIGECYVHQMMDGEAIKLQNDTNNNNDNDDDDDGGGGGGGGARKQINREPVIFELR